MEAGPDRYGRWFERQMHPLLPYQFRRGTGNHRRLGSSDISNLVDNTARNSSHIRLRVAGASVSDSHLQLAGLQAGRRYPMEPRVAGTLRHSVSSVFCRREGREEEPHGAGGMPGGSRK